MEVLPHFYDTAYNISGMKADRCGNAFIRQGLVVKSLKQMYFKKHISQNYLIEAYNIQCSNARKKFWHCKMIG